MSATVAGRSAPGMSGPELVTSALEDARPPRGVSDLLRVLERLSAGEVAAGLVAVVRARAALEPNLPLVELAQRAA